MKSLSLPLLSVIVMISASCTKTNDVNYLQVPGTADTASMLMKNWKLDVYTIKTNKWEYSYVSNDIASFSLLHLKFNDDFSYVTSDSLWSGSYRFETDSTRLVFSPYNPEMVNFYLAVNYLNHNYLELVSPVVSTDDTKSNPTDYERFIIYQGLKRLTSFGEDCSGIRTIQLKFSYIPYPY